VTLNGDDTISMTDSLGMNGEPRKWREVRPFVAEVGGRIC